MGCSGGWESLAAAALALSRRVNTSVPQSGRAAAPAEGLVWLPRCCRSGEWPAGAGPWLFTHTLTTTLILKGGVGGTIPGRRGTALAYKLLRHQYADLRGPEGSAGRLGLGPRR